MSKKTLNCGQQCTRLWRLFSYPQRITILGEFGWRHRGLVVSLSKISGYLSAFTGYNDVIDEFY